MFPLFNSHSAANHCYVAQPNCPHLIDYYGGPAKYLFILQPGYDPLSEYCALGAGSQANGGREIRPGWQALRDPCGFGRARIGRFDPRANPVGSDSRGIRMRDTARRPNAMAARPH